jgi:hypothetical protein
MGLEHSLKNSEKVWLPFQHERSTEVELDRGTSGRQRDENVTNVQGARTDERVRQGVQDHTGGLDEVLSRVSGGCGEP